MIIKNITKSYGKKKILNGVSLEADKGTCIGILGSNGSGKSTILSILAGVLKSDSGSFMLDGVNLLTDTRARIASVGYVPQATPLIDELSAYDNLRLWYNKNELENALDNGVLKLLGINDFLKVSVKKMSGGMKKRLSIGCAASHNVEILLLDEPCAALDLACKENIASYLTSFKQNGGIIIIATHDIQEIPLCDKLFILNDGVLEPYEFDGDIHKLAMLLSR